MGTVHSAEDETMAKAEVTWIEREQFVGIDGSDHSVVLSTQGEGNGVGLKPADLLLIALAGCTAVDVVRIIAKGRQTLTGMKIEVQADQAPDPPWEYRSIHMHYRLKGALRSEVVERAIELSEQKYCSVSASLRPQVDITTSYEILQEAE
jgi:putative redox protein